METQKKFLIFSQKKAFIFQEMETPKSSLYFRRELPNSKNEKNPLLQAWKFGRNDRFVTTSFPSIIKDSNNKSFHQIQLQNTNGFFANLTGKHFYNLAYKLHFLHTDLPTLHKRACFSTTIPLLSIYLECSPTQCVIKNNAMFFNWMCFTTIN